MAYKFPWTNYHELNLDWILNTVKELFAKTEQNNAIVEQYDGRLTEVELTADNAQTAAEQAQQNSTAALDLAQGAQTTATQAQQAAAQAQQAAGQAQTAAGQALEAAATAQQTATQAQQTAQNFDGRIRQAEDNAASALQAAQAFDEQVQGAITAANNANEAATAALTTSAETARELAAQRSTLEDIIENAAQSLEVDLSTKADVIINTAAGGIASFNDGADGQPIRKLVAQIEPVQDLHGYENPWPAGGGKNLGLMSDDNIQNIQRCTFVYQNNGVVASANGIYGRANFHFSVQSGETYTISFVGLIDSEIFGRVYYGNNNEFNAEYGFSNIMTSEATYAKTFTATNNDLYVGVYVTNGNQTSGTITIKNFMLEKGSSATAFAPYSNICPISGHTEAEIYHETEYDADADPKIYVTFPSEAGAIYGGILTINSDRTWALVVDRRFIIIDGVNNIFTGGYGGNGASRLPAFVLGSGENRAVDIGSGHITNYLKYNNYANSRNSFTIGNSGQLIVAHINDIMGNDGTYGYNSDAELLAAANTYVTDNPLQVCYTLATPITYTLTESEISAFLSTLYGANAIWTDVGSVNVEYPADTKIYIDNKFAELQALILEH